MGSGYRGREQRGPETAFLQSNAAPVDTPPTLPRAVVPHGQRSTRGSITKPDKACTRETTRALSESRAGQVSLREASKALL